MADDQQLYQTLGRIEGSQDALANLVKSYITAHDIRHTTLDASVSDMKDDISQAKGAKGMLIAGAGVVSAVVGTVVVVISKWIK